MHHPPRVAFAVLASPLLLALACGDDAPAGTGGSGGAGGSTPVYTAPDREDGDRTPLHDVCDDIDPERCLLPWPNDAFARVDATTETGLRLDVALERLNPDDDASLLARADGFSRVTPLVTSFAERLAPPAPEASVRVFLAEPGHPDRGAEVPMRIEVAAPDPPQRDVETMLVATPRVPLAPNARYVAVVTDALRAEGGGALTATHRTAVALDRAPAESQVEADYRGHHAPTRRLLADVGVDPATVLRVWDFTTRSAEDPRRRLRAMRAAAIAAVDDGDAEVVIDTVERPIEGSISAIVRGHLTGLPSWLRDEEGLQVGDDGAVIQQGTRDAPFRVLIPRGEGDYRVVMFGHGTGGNVDDAAFDETFAAHGAAKVNIELYGWTDDTVIGTFLRLQDAAYGSNVAAGSLVQAMADGAAIRRALTGPIADAVAADTLGGEPNPDAGRRPDDSVPLWVGGSLGGTVGLLFTASNPDVDHAVLNVPGAAWTSWVRGSEFFDYIRAFLAARNGGAQNVPLAVAIGQTLFDEADGAVWDDVLSGEHPIVALVQESIDDPILPNAGTEMVAHVIGATIVGEPLVDIEGLGRADELHEESGLTQFWVTGDGTAVHGFAAEDTAAGAAASEQIFAFVESAWAGDATITVPSGCPDGVCDFR